MVNDSDNGDQVTILLPTNLLAQIDAQIGSQFSDRTDFLLSATRHYLEHLHSKDNFIQGR